MTYARVWAIDYNEKGNKICNVRYFMPYPTHVQEQLGISLDLVFGLNIKIQLITDEIKIAKLYLLGL